MKQIILKKYFSIIAKLAKRSLKPSSIVIGFTGSVGKTSSRMIISSVLKQLCERSVYSSSQNFNGELGLPLSILGIEKHSASLKGLIDTLANATIKSFFGTKKYDILALEYGIDHIGEMDFMLDIVKPDISVTTIIDKVHGSQLGTPENIANEKYKLAKNTKLLPIICNDDPYVQIGKNMLGEKKYVSYGKDSDIILKEFEIFEKDGIPYSKANIIIENEQYNILSNMISRTSVLAIGVGIYIVKYLGGKVDKTLEFDINLLAGRENFLSGKNGLMILDSTYNASPTSVKKMLQDFDGLAKTFDRKKLVLLGDMRELGAISKAQHENMAQEVLKTSPEKVFLVGDQIQFLAQELIRNGFDEKNMIISNRSDKIGKKILDFIEKNDNKYILLAKGSQNTIFLEEALKELIDQKDHSKLVRQSSQWLEKKQKYFSSL